MKNYQLSIKSCPFYKDSGVEGLGEVPENWAIRKAKTVCSHVKDGTHGSFSRVDIGYPLLSVRNIVNSKFVFLDDDSLISEEDYRSISKSLKIRSGDLQLAIVGATMGKVALVPENMTDFVTQRSLATLRPIIKILTSKFFLYFASCSYFQDTLWSNTSYSAQPGIYLNSLSNIDILVPALPEQKAIAQYLDTKTAQIDRKIDLLTQKAKSYADLKRSLINETVTRGRDRSVPMKDSGIEWLGEVPKHWETKRVNDIASQQKRKNVGLVEKNLLSLSYGKIKRRDIDTSFGLLPESFETYQIVEAGNIILRLTDLQNDQRSLRVGLAKERGIITSAYLCLKFVGDVYPVFAYYLLFVYDISKVFYWFGGGLRQSMKFDDIKVFPFIFPPLSEQKAIADYLDTKTAQIDQIIQTINTQIETLKSKRSKNCEKP